MTETDPIFEAASTSLAYIPRASSSLYLLNSASTSLPYIPFASSTLYVPYTGATGGVNLNNQSLANVSTLSVGSTTSSIGGVAFFNGNVGIGTSTPTSPLTVNGVESVLQLSPYSNNQNIVLSGGIGNSNPGRGLLTGGQPSTNTPAFTFTGMTGTGIGNPYNGSNALTFDASGSLAMIITGNQQVGIGTTTPSAQLVIVSSTSTNNTLVVQGASSQTANLQEWQNAAGKALASINSAGFLNLGGVDNSTQTLLSFTRGAGGGHGNFIGNSNGNLQYKVNGAGTGFDILWLGAGQTGNIFRILDNSSLLRAAITAAGGGYFSSSTGIGTTTPAVLLDVGNASSTIGAIATSSGVTDLVTLTGTYTGNTTQALKIQITATSSTGDTFEWNVNGSTQNTGFIASTTAVALNYIGISVTFATTTGHTIGNYWTSTLTPSNGNINASNAYYLNEGLFASAFGTGNTSVGLGSMSANTTGINNTANG